MKTALVCMSIQVYARDLPRGARFRYLGQKKVFAVINNYPKSILENGRGECVEILEPMHAIELHRWQSSYSIYDEENTRDNLIVEWVS